MWPVRQHTRLTKNMGNQSLHAVSQLFLSQLGSLQLWGPGLVYTASPLSQYAKRAQLPR